MAPPKVTVAQLAAAAEAEKAARERAAEQMRKAARKEVTEDAYAGLVGGRNSNREVESVEASGLDDALAALQRLELEGEGGEDGPMSPRGGQPKQKAHWKAYEEANLEALQAEKPGLRKQQYTELLWKMWAKAPENPLNAALLGPARPKTPMDLSNKPVDSP